MNWLFAATCVGLSLTIMVYVLRARRTDREQKLRRAKDQGKLLELKAISRNLDNSKRNQWFFDRDKYLSGLGKDFHCTNAVANDNEYILAVSNDQMRLLRFKQINFQVEEDVKFAPNDVVSISFKSKSVQSTYIERKITEQKVEVAKSPIKRAIVGGLILGPTGAIVGAISGVGTKSAGTKTVTINVPHTISKISEFVILISTRSARLPTIYISTSQESELDRWIATLKAFASDISIDQIG